MVKIFFSFHIKIFVIYLINYLGRVLHLRPTWQIDSVTIFSRNRCRQASARFLSTEIQQIWPKDRRVHSPSALPPDDVLLLRGRWPDVQAFPVQPGRDWSSLVWPTAKGLNLLLERLINGLPGQIHYQHEGEERGRLPARPSASKVRVTASIRSPILGPLQWNREMWLKYCSNIIQIGTGSHQSRI